MLIGNCLKTRIEVDSKSQSGQSGKFHAVPITQAEAPDTDILTLPFSFFSTSIIRVISLYPNDYPIRDLDKHLQVQP